ncbi:MAG: acyl carrier protein [Chloroflexi bacterium]|nr:acyl carrier protein [Chloroflexota bacterium]
MTAIDTRNDAELRDRVRELLATTFVMDPSELPDDVSQQTCARWTSLYHMMLLMVLEEQFGVTFEMEEMTSMTSLPRIIAVLKEHGVNA